ncbi:fumarylacetoacetate hydrolase family protein [Parafrigoribacterium soli]|uniref:fumarylacetoacetate hydrolase family protein n=1 Tax=Parafrigoribacterium soli TaxID=3144663 RepID=UPI0032ECFB04
MRLVSFAHDGRPRPGALIGSPEGDRVLDLSSTMPAGRHGVERIISDAEMLRVVAEAVRVQTAERESGQLHLVTEVTLVEPVRPGKILCLGYNYRGHVPVGVDPTTADPEFPDVFVKTPNVLAGPSDSVTLPRASTDVDYEGEIALVIGRRAHQVPFDRAMDCVAGLTLFNDVSARDWQGRSSQWELGKCFDGFGVLGPAIVTLDEVPDPHDLLLEVVRDGIVTVSQSTSTMVFSMPLLVHYLSQVMTLEPGDIISTGSPQKTADALAAHRPLADGDAVTIRVAGLGELTTSFVSPTVSPISGVQP